MQRTGRGLWTGVVVGVFGLAVGASNLVRGFGEVINTRHVVVGAVCTVVATAWLLFLLLSRKWNAVRSG